MTSRASYARPDQYVPLADIRPRPLVPFIPPSPSNLPPLPSPLRKSLIDESYILTTHLVPAACPRTTPYVPEPQLPPFTKDKQKYRAATTELGEHIIDVKGKEVSGELNAEESHAQLWNCVNRYVKRDQSPKGTKRDGKPLTLFFAHANGFPKEVSTFCVSSSGSSDI